MSYFKVTWEQETFEFNSVWYKGFECFTYREDLPGMYKSCRYCMCDLYVCEQCHVFNKFYGKRPKGKRMAKVQGGQRNQQF